MNLLFFSFSDIILLVFGRYDGGQSTVWWKANNNPPWAAYRALRGGRLVAVDKMSGVRPLGVGETLEKLESKCVLLVCGNKAKEACGVDQLCAGLDAGIEAGVHAATLIW